MPHRLDPLMSPRAVAFLGASPRPDTPGNDMLRMVKRAGFTGKVYPVNPKYESVENLRCYPSLAALPERVDHVVLGLANAGLEAALDEAIRHGARAATIFASLYLENDRSPPLLERIQAKAREAGLAICGGNCMGFYNDADRFWAVGFPAAREPRPGHIAFISHSGSIFGALAHNDPRFRFNLCVSPGQELVTTVADYMDYALELESTRVIGLFIEAVRDPESFVQALDKAARRQVPVVVLKVGRTEESARMALGHSGAMTGDDAAHDALFRRYGALRVATVDELAASLLLFQQGRRLGSGGLAAILDSGGECEMITDLAQERGIPFAKIGQRTRAALAARLDHGLEPRNPLDAWGTGRDFVGVFHDCMKALHDDAETALLVHFADIRTGYYVHEGYLAAHRRLIGETMKPVAIATNYTQLRHEAIVGEFDRLGIPVIDGTIASLTAIGHALSYRDFLARADDPAPMVPPSATAEAERRLATGRPLGEADALQLFAAFDIPTVRFRLAGSLEAAARAATELGYPVALKTALPDLMHKTEADGVRLALADPEQLRKAYGELAERLGPLVVVAQMAGPGVEVMLGMKRDPQFGPVIILGLGGVLAEAIACSTHELAPFGTATARRALERLGPLMKLLAGPRGRPAADLQALAALIARFSAMAARLADHVAEIDANPVIAGPKGAVVADGLVVPIRLRPKEG